MHRCKCCDYSPFTQSEFNASLIYSDKRRRLYVDKPTGHVLCEMCKQEIQDDLYDTFDNAYYVEDWRS